MQRQAQELAFKTQKDGAEAAPPPTYVCEATWILSDLHVTETVQHCVTEAVLHL